MGKLRTSTKDNPILQEEALEFLKANPDAVFEVEKIEIPVQLTKAKGGEAVHTITLARDGRTIDETSNTAGEGFGIDTRSCIDGSLDQYAKKPAKVSGSYTIDDGRSFEDLAPGETVKAHTKGREVRKAFVATEDMYLATTWGEIQFIARGGIVTFSGEEAIGNNNPCDMVLHTPSGNGREVLTSHHLQVSTDMVEQGLPLSKGAKQFLKVIKEEDSKNPLWEKMNSLLTSLTFGLRQAKAKTVFVLRGKAPELKDSRDHVLSSSKDKPISQAEALAYIKMNPDAVFEVEKIEIPVQLTKAKGGEAVHTITLARDGRTIDETTNTAGEGFGIDTRTCINGAPDQYAKKPAKVEGGYTIDDGRSFEELKAGETVKAHTKGREVRKAFVAPFDMYLDTTWGEVQFIAKGGIVTFSGDEAIGNNNPCDMVLHTPSGNGSVVLTEPASKVKNNARTSGLSLSKGAKKFLSIAHAEDVRSPYVSTWREVVESMKAGILMVPQKIFFFGKKEDTTFVAATEKKKKRSTGSKTNSDKESKTRE